MTSLPSLDTKCGKYFKFRDLIECGETYQSIRPNNIPQSSKTYKALQELAHVILDPVVNQFGKLELTYGMACPELYRKIKSRISPSIDQHAAFELNSKGRQICSRGGAAVDFYCPDICSMQLAQWIVRNGGFDRLYFYGVHRPIHVSVGPEHSGSVVLMRRRQNSDKRVPHRISVKKFLALNVQHELIVSCTSETGQMA